MASPERRPSFCANLMPRGFWASTFLSLVLALFAYEMKAGVLFESSVQATNDFDLLWDAPERLRLVVIGVSSEGVLVVLKKAEPTYSTADNHGIRAQNANGYYVDLICPDTEPTPSRLATLAT